MIVRLLSKDIPNFWEQIKFAAVKVNNIEEKYRQAYCNDLLQNLLSDSSQCFVRLSDDSQLDALLVTQIKHNVQYDVDYLYVECLYSWQIVGEEVWKRDINFIKEFAKSVKCKYIGASSSNPRAQEIMLLLGFDEFNRTYALKV